MPYPLYCLSDSQIILYFNFLNRLLWVYLHVIIFPMIYLYFGGWAIRIGVQDLFLALCSDIILIPGRDWGT